ncbi:MAG: lipopolysaccharide biosynthesis protein [Alphaproteobacteria bacterium]|nr:lipopolysaccharide biosynthesis protein [Alphaproteobacteria bacterium]
MNQLARKTVNGAAINMMVTVSKTLLQFAIVLPILARVLPPSDFGLVAMALAFVSFFTMFNDLGISAALVRADKPSAAFWSTAFWTNVMIGALLSLGLYWLAPHIADFYGEPIVSALVQVLCGVLFMHCIILVPTAWLQRNFKFSTIALIDLCATILAAIMAISLALNGLGVWALAWQQLTFFGIKAIGGLLAHKAPIELTYKPQTVIEVLPFSLGLTGTALVGFLSRNSDNILIGRYLGADQLGFYGRAYQVMMMPVRSLAQSASFALYPALAAIQQDRRRLGRIMLRANSVLSALIIPLMTGVSVVAVPFVGLMFGPNWSPVIPLIQVLAFVGIIQAIMATSNVALKAIGRSDILLRWSLIRMVTFVAAFAIGVNLKSLVLLTQIYLGANILLFVPFQLMVLGHMKVTPVEFIQSVLPQAISALIMALVLSAVQYTYPQMQDWTAQVKLDVMVPMGIALYGLTMVLVFRRFVRELVGEARVLFLRKSPA